MAELIQRAVVSGLNGGKNPYRTVKTDDLTWRVQVEGQGPVLLLIHGTGASLHSWRKLVPLLTPRFTVVAPDMPGHGQSSGECDACLSLPGMATAFTKLMAALGLTPALAAGHSAGAAVLVRMCLDRSITPAAVISINGALLPFHGFAGQIFAPLAKVLVVNPFVPRFLAWRARDSRTVAKLLADTGSNIDAEGVELYAELFRNPDHVAATLGMMASWDLEPLNATIKDLKIPLWLLAAQNDKTIAPETATRVGARVPNARVIFLPGLGHLAHEENPELFKRQIFQAADEAGLPAAP